MAYAEDKAANKTNEIYFPHEHVEKVTVAETDIPYEKKLMMKEHDAVIFILPQQRPVSVWCYRPDERTPLAEQRTKSGLKTAWGEKPWIRVRTRWRSLDGTSRAADGWDSYIQMGGVTTVGDRQSDYRLYVGDLRLNIIEDLRATNGLPVTIRVTKTNGDPVQVREPTFNGR